MRPLCVSKAHVIYTPIFYSYNSNVYNDAAVSTQLFFFQREIPSPKISSYCIVYNQRELTKYREEKYNSNNKGEPFPTFQGITRFELRSPEQHTR